VFLTGLHALPSARTGTVNRERRPAIRQSRTAIKRSIGRMNFRPLVAPILFLLLVSFTITQADEGQQAMRSFDPLRGSLERSEPHSIYAPDPEDAWNQVFFLLFTRTIASRVRADGATPLASGDDRLALSSRRVTRIESGDRAIDPLYPSWLWMGSTAFDIEHDRPWRILREPVYSRLVVALEGVRRTARSRPALARALMQADLWCVHDMLDAMTRPRPGPATGDRAERERRAQALLPLVAATMRALALPGEEIARLPDTYSAAATAHGLPDLLGDRSDWMEIRWFPDRSHEYAADHRRAARVFFRPAERPNDAAAFLQRFRERQGDNLAALESVALLIQLLLVASDGTVVPSPITYQAQFRGSAARPRGAEIPQYDLSRRQLLSSPATGGLVGFDANVPAYLPIAGNDFSFATPPRLDGEPVLAPLGARCAFCHGSASGVGHLMTFARHTFPGQPVPEVVRLVTARRVHPGEVARRKMEREEFKALRQHWQ
jgi:hypothetical protein